MSRREDQPAGAAPKRLRCAIYTRKSSEEGLEQDYNSLHAQRDACEAYVRSQLHEGWILSPTLYDDGGFSGGNMERPGLTRLMAEIDAGRIDVVVVYKVDRLTRALADFAKIVERFDNKGVSFVSVTQAFNTTTSMGRLTLNVLLSFAQFEREVTSERIRDKIASSKKKGMWMGGNLALGYEPNGRTLTINEEEAERVRGIFRRYLKLGSVHLLAAELQAKGVLTKRYVSKRGTVRGGVPFGRGALFHLLSNRLYRGEIPHKGDYFPGQHAAIVEEALFEAVQKKLLTNAGAKRRGRAGLNPLIPNAPLAGRIFDDRGNPMSPVTARKGKSRLYRYYVSTALMLGRQEQVGSLGRFPAHELEALLRQRASELGVIPAGDGQGELWDRVARVEVGRRQVVVRFKLDRELDPDLLQYRRGRGEDVTVEEGELILVTPVHLRKRGGRNIVIGPEHGPAISAATVDLTLLKALVKAEAWKAQLLRGEAPSIDAIAKGEGVQAGYAQRVLRLAFLSPTLKGQILAGRAPPNLTLQRIMMEGLSLSWAEQERRAA